MIDRIPWDEADLSVKSLIYLSLGMEGCRTYHERNPHTKLERCSTREVFHELYSPKKHNLRQVLVLQGHATKQRVPESTLQPTSGTRLTL